LVLNLCALLGMLMQTMSDRIGIRALMIVQVGVLLTGLVVIGLPMAKGKRLEMLGIMGLAIGIPVVTFLFPYLFAADLLDLSTTNSRILSVMAFYASAITMTFISLSLTKYGWDANPKSVRPFFYLNLCFMLGSFGPMVTSGPDQNGVILGAIQYAMTLAMLIVIRLPIVAGWRWQFLGIGSLTFAGPFVLAQFSDSHWAFFGVSIPMNFIGLYLLRHGWIAEGAWRRVSKLGNVFLVLNLVVPILLYSIGCVVSRNFEWPIMLTPGWLFAIGLVLMFLGQAKNDLPPIKPLFGAGEMSFLVGSAMLSIIVLIDEAGRDERGYFMALGFFTLSFHSLHQFLRGFVSRWIRDSIQRFLFKWSVRGAFGLMALGVVGIVVYYSIGGWIGERAWTKYKVTSEAEGWKYRLEDYTREIPSDDENIFMAEPFKGYLHTQKKSEKPVYLNPAIRKEFEDTLDLAINPRQRIRRGQLVHWGDFAERIRSETKHRRLGDNSGAINGTDREVLAKYLAQFDNLFADLRAAVKRPKQYAPLALNENGSAIISAYLIPFKSLTQLLSKTNLARLANGDREGAMADVRLMFRIADVTGNNSTLMGQLSVVAQLNIIIQSLNVGLHTGGWSESHLAEWDKLLKIVQSGIFEQLENTIQNERLTGNRLFEYAVENWSSDENSLKEIGYTRFISKQRIYEDRICYDRCMKQFIEQIRQAQKTGQINRSEIRRIIRLASFEAMQKGYHITEMLTGALDIIAYKFMGAHKNLVSSARLGIAIERYRQKKGKLPAELNALVPKYIDAIPNDPFTGKPLNWEYKDLFRYTIDVGSNLSGEWIYDPIRTAVETGNLDTLKSFEANGWKITKPKAGTTQPPDGSPIPNMAGMMPYGMMGPGMSLGQGMPGMMPYGMMGPGMPLGQGMPGMMVPEMGIFGGRNAIDFSAPETEILTQQNALHHAMHSGNPELVQWLIERGLDPNTTASIWTPQPADEEVVGRMDDMFSMGMMGMGGDGGSERTVLEFAVSEQQTEMVKVLLDAGVLPIEADEEPKRPGNPTPPGMGMPGMMGGMPGMIVPPTGNPYGMMGMGMPGMGMPLPETPTAFELANTEILPLLLAKVPKELLPKALGEDSVVSLLRKTLAKRDLAKARLLIEKGANVNHPPPSLEPEAPEPGEFGSPGMPLGQGMPGMPPGMMPMPKSIWIDGYLYHEGLGGGMGMMEDTNKVDLTTLSVVSQAARIGDWDFFNLVLEKGGDSNRREIDASTPLHHAAANPDGAILKQLLAKQPDLTAKDNSGKSPAVHAAKAGLLDNVKQLQQAGSDLNNKAVVNVSIQSLNIKLLAHLINNAKKPLNENSTWAEALGILATEIPDDADEEQTANIRKIGTLLFDNGLRSNSIQNIEDLERAITEAQ